MIIVTGGAGFIGSNIVKALNENGQEDILIVDNLTNSDKSRNLNGLAALDFIDKEDFIQDLKQGAFNNEEIKAVFHQGACSDTMEYNGKYMMQNNYEYSKQLLLFCIERKIPFIYASSASVYGRGKNGFSEREDCEQALNMYAFSKLFFDRYVRRVLPRARSQVVGLRYFNVFGPQENHKGRMASIVYQMYCQMKQEGCVKLFAGVDGFADGEQRRDFIYVRDVVNINLFFLRQTGVSGIFNCGTGEANSFNLLAKGVLDYFKKGRIEYIPFPVSLTGKYQSHTQADTEKLLTAGYQEGFTPIREAVTDYCRRLDETDGFFG